MFISREQALFIAQSSASPIDLEALGGYAIGLDNVSSCRAHTCAHSALLRQWGWLGLCWHDQPGTGTFCNPEISRELMAKGTGSLGAVLRHPLLRGTLRRHPGHRLRSAVRDTDGNSGRGWPGVSSLPPHPEVPGALAALARTRLRLVALTNSLQHIAETQLASAGLSGYLEAVLSADATGHLKPAPQPYHAVAERCGVPIGEVAPGRRALLGHRRGHGRRMPGRIRRPPRHGTQPTRRPAWHHRPGPSSSSPADHQHRRVNRPPPGHAERSALLRELAITAAYVHARRR